MPKLALLNEHGEYLDVDRVVVRNQKQKQGEITGRFAMLMLDSLNRIAADKSLRGTELRVMLTMWTEMDYGGVVTASQSYLASRLDIPRASATTAIRRLVQANIVSKISVKGVTAYQFNPEIITMGKPSRQQ